MSTYVSYILFEMSHRSRIGSIGFLLIVRKYTERIFRFMDTKLAEALLSVGLTPTLQSSEVLGKAIRVSFESYTKCVVEPSIEL